MIKEQVENLIDKFLNDIITAAEIDSEGDPYISGLYIDSEIVGEFIDSVNKVVGNKEVVANLFKPKSIEEIKDSITLTNYRDFEELEQVDVICSPNPDVEYDCVTYVYKHTPTGKYLSVDIKTVGSENLEIMASSIVEKSIGNHT